MTKFPTYLITQAILAAQARLEDPEAAAVSAVRAHKAAASEFEKANDPNGDFLRKASALASYAPVIGKPSLQPGERSTNASETQ